LKFQTALSLNAFSNTCQTRSIESTS